MSWVLTCLRCAVGICAALLLLAVLAAAGFAAHYYRPVLEPALRSEWDLRCRAPEALAAHTQRLRSEIPRLAQEGQCLRQEALGRLPPAPYVAIDTRSNVFLVWENGMVVWQGICSTGMKKELVVGKRRWFFDTPRGVFSVLKKTENPVWSKPDWAFYEEGEKPPAPDSPERIEEAVLGQYALSLGDGYLIHGTIYKRLMGKSVTHGCVRLDDADLEFVYQTAQVGTKVYIY